MSALTSSTHNSPGADLADASVTSNTYWQSALVKEKKAMTSLIDWLDSPGDDTVHPDDDSDDDDADDALHSDDEESQLLEQMEGGLAPWSPISDSQSKKFVFPPLSAEAEDHEGSEAAEESVADGEEEEDDDWRIERLDTVLSLFESPQDPSVRPIGTELWNRATRIQATLQAFAGTGPDSEELEPKEFATVIVNKLLSLSSLAPGAHDEEEGFRRGDIPHLGLPDEEDDEGIEKYIRTWTESLQMIDDLTDLQIASAHAKDEHWSLGETLKDVAPALAGVAIEFSSKLRSGYPDFEAERGQ